MVGKMMGIALRSVWEVNVSDQLVVSESYLPTVSILEELAGCFGVTYRPGFVSDFDGVVVRKSAECVMKVQGGSRL